MRNTLALAVLVLAAGQAAAVNKCVGPDGKVTFSDAVCPAGADAATIKERQNSIDTSAGHAKNREAVEAIERGKAYQRCITAKESVGYATKLGDYVDRKAEARKACGEAPPSPEQSAAARDRIQRAAATDAINRNTQAVQDANRRAAASTPPKKLELDCKRGVLSTLECAQR
jgi:hypothetical protein